MVLLYYEVYLGKVALAVGCETKLEFKFYFCV